MPPEALYLGLVLLGALVCFYTGWLRPDVTALVVMLALMVPPAPILTVGEAVSGFGSSAVIMVASMFVLSAAMVRTGGARLVGEWVLAAGAKSERRLQLTVFTVVTVFSAFINDTSTVIIWMPLVLVICRQYGYAPRRFLLLLAFASLLGGQWTLIGTRSNILVSDYLATRTGEGFGFFAFTPVAVAIFLAALLYLVGLGLKLLPAGKAASSVADRYDVKEFLTEVMATPASDLVGRTLGELDLQGRHGVSVLQVIRAGEHLPPSDALRVQDDDILVIQGPVSRITSVLEQPGLQFKEELALGDRTLRSLDLRMVEALVAPGSAYLGRTPAEIDLAGTYDVSLLAVGHQGRPLAGSPIGRPLELGDSLLVVGHEHGIDRMRGDEHLLLLESRPLPSVKRTKAWLSIALLAAVAVLAATRLLHVAFVIPAAALVAVLTGCIGRRQAYAAIDLPALVVVGAMIPYGLALEKTGVAHFIATAAATPLGAVGPAAVLAALLAVTILLTQLIENAAVAIILAPIGYEVAVETGADPALFLLAVAICTSSAFMTPIAHESTILVMGPGQYRFRDYLRVGTPLALLTWGVTTLLIALRL